MHPQCNMDQADAISRINRKAAAGPKVKSHGKERKKICAKCFKLIPTLQMVCDCGHQFPSALNTATSTPEAPAVESSEQSSDANVSSKELKMPITPVGDNVITRQVQGKLAGRGLGSPCRILVTTLKGQVTLSGTVQQSHQKGAAVQIARAIGGVRAVLDQMTVKAAQRN
jgi:hyperosmotically inducible protein